MSVDEIKSFLSKYPEGIHDVFNFLPMSDWEEAANIALKGYNKGYYTFGVWEGWKIGDDGEYEPMKPTINDIVGVNPETGMVEFLSYNKEEE